jgi:hypothetical protein
MTYRAITSVGGIMAATEAIIGSEGHLSLTDIQADGRRGHNHAFAPDIAPFYGAIHCSLREPGEVARSTPERIPLTRNEGKPQGEAQPVGEAENGRSWVC